LSEKTLSEVTKPTPFCFLVKTVTAGLFCEKLLNVTTDKRNKENKAVVSLCIGEVRFFMVELKVGNIIKILPNYYLHNIWLTLKTGYFNIPQPLFRNRHLNLRADFA
jgi:hypothetical protein